MTKRNKQIPKHEIIYLNKKKKKFCLIIPIINEGRNIQNLLNRIYKINQFFNPIKNFAWIN